MKDEPWRGDMHARCLHLEAKLGRQAREIERMERKLAEAKALLRELRDFPYVFNYIDDDSWLSRRDALLNPTNTAT